MRVLVLGASGATGSLVVRQLTSRNIQTRVLVRRSVVLSKAISESPLVETVKGNIHELGPSEMEVLVQNCDVVVSCLGHNISFKGIFGPPHDLVRDAIRRVWEAAKQGTSGKVKLILMSTTACTHFSLGEKNPFGERLVLSLLQFFLPPHRDNVKAAQFLIQEVGRQDEKMEWVMVRPDTLVNNDEESAYETWESTTRSPVFHPGQTSRINVSHFMAELVSNEELWNTWVFQAPVIYNS